MKHSILITPLISFYVHSAEAKYQSGDQHIFLRQCFHSICDCS